MEGGEQCMAQTADTRIAIRISREQKKVLQEKARQEGRSLSNWAIRTLLAKEMPSHDNPRRTKRV